MGRVPLVEPPITGPSPSQNVRVNPDITAPIDRAAQGIASSVDQFAGVAARVKHASDTAFIIGANAQMEASQRDFHAWTTTHPDTVDWDKELSARLKGTSDQISADAKDRNLSPIATQELAAHVAGWQTRTTAFGNQLRTEQEINNAAGIGNLAIDAAVTNRDEHGAVSVVDTLQSQGVYSATVAAAKKKRITEGIATMTANDAIGNDAFGAIPKLEEKNAAGEYVNYQAMPIQGRLAAITRANKLAAETRANTLRFWAGQIDSARRDGTQMPDRDGLVAEGEKMGIKPVEIERMMKPVDFDPTVKADLSTRILSPKYNPFTDPNAETTRANLEHEVYKANLPPHLRDELLKQIADKNDPLHVFNSPVFKEAMQRNDYNLTHEVYGKYESKVRDPKTGEFNTVINKAMLGRAQETQSRVTDALTVFVQQHPTATQKDLTDFIKQVYSGVAGKAGAAIFKFN